MVDHFASDSNACYLFHQYILKKEFQSRYPATQKDKYDHLALPQTRNVLLSGWLAILLLFVGSTSVISNIIAGYTMTYRRAFKIGDRVCIGETIGEVLESRLLVPHLNSLKNEKIVIPKLDLVLLKKDPIGQTPTCFKPPHNDFIYYYAAFR